MRMASARSRCEQTRGPFAQVRGGLRLLSGVWVLASALLAFSPGDVQAQRLTPEEAQAQIAKLGSEDPTDRVAAVEVLGRRGYKMRRDIVPHLQRLLKEDPDWRVRASSGRAVGRLGTREAVPELVRGLRDPQVDVRVVCAAALWRLPDPAAVPALLELIKDGDESARDWAVLALGVIRDQRATQPLIAMLSDPADNVRMDVIRSLGRIGDVNGLAALRAHANNKDRPMDERLEALNSIGALRGPEKVNVLVRFLPDPESQIRRRAAVVLGQVGDALVIPQIRRRLPQEKDAEVEAALKEALTAIEERMKEGGETDKQPGKGVPASPGRLL